MSGYAHRFVYEIGLQWRNTKIQGKAKSGSNNWKYGHVILSSNQTWMQKWELLHYRNTEKIDCFSVDSYCNHCKTVFEAMCCYFHFRPCQEARPSLTDNDIKRGTRIREMDELRKNYIREKGCFVEEMWECSWWDQFKNNLDVEKSR